MRLAPCLTEQKEKNEQNGGKLNKKSGEIPPYILNFFLLFFLPFIIKLSIQAASGSGGRGDFISHISMPRVASTRFAASMPVTQARSKKKAGVS